MRIRAYYYNMVKDGKVLGSVKCENATQAKVITAIILGVDPESLSTRRVSSVVAASPLELYKKPEEKTTHEEEKSSTGDTSPKRQVIVDFSKSSKNEGQPNAKQMAAWAQLKQEVADSDSVSLNSIESVWYVDSNGLMQVSFSYFLNTTIMRVREVIIGRGGAVHGYGRKPRGTEKLLTVKKDVLKYCYKDEKISLQ